MDYENRNHHKESIEKDGIDRIEKVLSYLHNRQIEYDIYYHPPLPTIDEAMLYWSNIDATHCKNLFFRNHKGDKHYLILLNHRSNMDIHSLEKRLKEGKLSFASEARMIKHLGVKPGSVSFFGLINNTEKNVILFIEKNLLTVNKISFHPNDNRATVVISGDDFRKILDSLTHFEVFD